jgi:hypothetical protein
MEFWFVLRYADRKTMRTLSLSFFVLVTLSGSQAMASWWCATNFYDHADQVCMTTQEACKGLSDSSTSHFVDCWEVENVTMFEFTQVNDGRKLVACPLPSQCEKRRRALMKNRVDYREISKCYSSASLASESGVGSPDTMDLPGGGLGAISDGKDWLVIKCSPVLPPTKVARVRCQVVRLSIEEHSQAEIERRQQKLAAEFATGLTETKMRELCDGLLKEVAPKGKSGGEKAEREFLMAAKQACAAKDRKALTKVWLDSNRESTRACRASVSLEEREFKRVDANTWTNRTGGASDGMSVVTLWRDKVDGPKSDRWNYKEQKTAPPSNLFPAGLTEVFEYSWRSYSSRDIGCPTMFGPLGLW